MEMRFLKNNKYRAKNCLMQAKESIKSTLGTENRKLLGGGTLSAPQFSVGRTAAISKKLHTNS